MFRVALPLLFAVVGATSVAVAPVRHVVVASFDAALTAVVGEAQACRPNCSGGGGGGGKGGGKGGGVPKGGDKGGGKGGNNGFGNGGGDGVPGKSGMQDNTR